MIKPADLVVAKAVASAFSSWRAGHAFQLPDDSPVRVLPDSNDQVVRLAWKPVGDALQGAAYRPGADRPESLPFPLPFIPGTWLFWLRPEASSRIIATWECADDCAVDEALNVATSQLRDSGYTINEPGQFGIVKFAGPADEGVIMQVPFSRNVLFMALAPR